MSESEARQQERGDCCPVSVSSGARSGGGGLSRRADAVGRAQVLEQLERDWVDALRRGDGDTLDRIWDEDFVFTDPRGHSLSRDDCLREIRAGALRMGEAEVRRLRAHIFGDTGVVVGTIALRGVAGRTAYDGEYSFVDVYARRQGQWRAVLSSGDVAGTLMA